MQIRRFQNLTSPQKALLFPTIAVLLFGVMGYFLGELCGDFREEWPLRSVSSVIHSVLLDKYLLWAALSFGVSILLYRGMVCLPRQTSRTRWICRTFAALLTVWNICAAALCIVSCAQSDGLTPIYEGSDVSWYVSRAEEIEKIRSRSVWFGRAEHYYTYPEYASETALEVAEAEQTRAYFTFGRWRSETLLPVLTYCFGKWVGLLYTGIVFLWFLGSIAGLLAVKGRSRKMLYGSCMGVVGIQLLLTVLDYYGIVCWDMPLVFSTADWTAMIPIAAMQLTVMFFLVRDNPSDGIRAGI